MCGRNWVDVGWDVNSGMLEHKGMVERTGADPKECEVERKEIDDGGKESNVDRSGRDVNVSRRDVPYSGSDFDRK